MRRVRDTAGMPAPAEAEVEDFGDEPAPEPTDEALLAELTGEEPASAPELSEPAIVAEDVLPVDADAPGTGPPPLAPDDLGSFQKDALTAVLQAACQRREAAEKELAEAMTQVHTAIRVAHEGGLAKLAIASAAGVSRQTVYNVLATEEKGGGD